MRVLLAATVSLVIVACTRTPEAQMPTPRTDELAVRDTVVAVVHRLDHRRWDELRALFDAEVETDYTSLFGGEVQRQPADALIATWKTVLSPLDTTQHVLGPIEVAMGDRQAVARCHVRGYHIAARAPNGSEWMVAGHYVWTLVERDGAWRVRSLTLETLYQTGNRALLQEAASTLPPP